MSRGRPRHHGSRRRAYSGRQREVRERRHHASHEEPEWLLDGARIEDDPADTDPQPAWTLRPQGRAVAA
jgi:hypothetical protein